MFSSPGKQQDPQEPGTLAPTHLRAKQGLLILPSTLKHTSGITQPCNSVPRHRGISSLHYRLESALNRENDVCPSRAQTVPAQQLGLALTGANGIPKMPKGNGKESPIPSRPRQAVSHQRPEGDNRAQNPPSAPGPGRAVDQGMLQHVGNGRGLGRPFSEPWNEFPTSASLSMGLPPSCFPSPPCIILLCLLLI